LVPPIYTSATFAFPDVGYGARCFTGEENGYFYTRIANPTLALLEGRLASAGSRARARWCSARAWGPSPPRYGPCWSRATKSWPTSRLYGCTFSFLHHGLGSLWRDACAMWT
jgi:methionine-gamma-lyase